MSIVITKLPAKVLREKTIDVPFPLSKEIKKLMKDMLVTCKKADGIGLAAPQIGKNLNFALVDLTVHGIEPFFVFNPKIVKTSTIESVIEEGCLSIPGVFGKVSRPKKITVHAQNYLGEYVEIVDDGWVARVLQHEIDHLNQTLICDRFSQVTQGHGLLRKFGISEK